jgi:hypothetical protein
MASPTLYPTSTKDVLSLLWLMVPPSIRASGFPNLQLSIAPVIQGFRIFYACMEDSFEELERVYDERYVRQHGRWRPIIRRVIHEFLDCGDLRHG